MNFRFLSLIACILITIGATGQVKHRYRVWLTDKAESTHYIDQPQSFLSDKAIERRARHNIDITEQDLPVSETYLQEIRDMGFRVIVTSRWMNTVVVAPGNDITIDKIEQLPFVEKVECVQNESRPSFPLPRYKGESRICNESNDNLDELATYYGASWTQINQLNLAPLHQAGYKGKGMTIAVVDAGFYCIDMHTGIDKSQIIGTHDFTRRTFSYKNGEDHGASVLICMAACVPNTYIGTAPEADYWLFITEDNNRECPIEEDYWVAGVEMADSVGADIVNSSLGYYEYDDPSMSYTTAHLDGKTAFCSRAATIAASKGLLIVTAAGNEYGNSWQKITVPGDADGILTVGSINSDGTHSDFSSCGNTADGRIKPDIVAMGKKAKILTHEGDIMSVNGTSFSTPIMSGALACLWQAHPEWSVDELIQQVQCGSSQYHTPDSLLGYGLPDIYNIHCTASGIDNTDMTHHRIYIDNGVLHLPHAQYPTIVTLYNIAGEVVLQKHLSRSLNEIKLPHLEQGIYIVILNSHDTHCTQKILIE